MTWSDNFHVLKVIIKSKKEFQNSEKKMKITFCAIDKWHLNA